MVDLIKDLKFALSPVITIFKNEKVFCRKVIHYRLEHQSNNCEVETEIRLVNFDEVCC